MNLTSTEIFKLVWDRIRDSLLGKTVPMMYADHYPNNPSGEFIVVGSLSNVVGDSQVATVNVNIYVPDTAVSAYKTASGWSKWAAYIKPLSEYNG